MDEPFQISRFFQSAFNVIWIFIYFAAAAMAFFCFRLTASGLVCGGVLILFGLKLILFKLFQAFIAPTLSGDPMIAYIPSFISYFLSFILALTLAVGIGFIPRSLRLLSEKS